MHACANFSLLKRRVSKIQQQRTRAIVLRGLLAYTFTKSVHGLCIVLVLDESDNWGMEMECHGLSIEIELGASLCSPVPAFRLAELRNQKIGGGMVSSDDETFGDVDANGKDVVEVEARQLQLDPLQQRNNGWRKLGSRRLCCPLYIHGEFEADGNPSSRTGHEALAPLNWLPYMVLLHHLRYYVVVGWCSVVHEPLKALQGDLYTTRELLCSHDQHWALIPEAQTHPACLRRFLP